MEIASKILSDVTVHMKYARFLPEESRRENWNEIVARNEAMHMRKYPFIKKDIKWAYDMVRDRKVLPSMRSMQFGGVAIEMANNRIYNCAYMPIDDTAAFSEAMFLLLGGTGVGYSVQKHHVAKLPARKHLSRHTSLGNEYRVVTNHTVADSIEGWADAVKALVEAYLVEGRSIAFDYSRVRPKGSPIKTSGGKAPGPEPLKICLDNVRTILESVHEGEKLTPLQVHDMMCHIADAVLSGGIRRAAMISLFSEDDNDMLTCKSGEWYINNGQRGRANNSVVLDRATVTREQFDELWGAVKASGFGEPGFYFTHNKEWGTNPCCEIALNPFQFCNLTEINASNIQSEEDLLERVKAATLIGTLQASYTNFHYLRPIWKKTTEEEALIGVSMTGIASGLVMNYDLKMMADEVKAVNAHYADLLMINPAARTTCVKPAGTTSLTLGTSSGIHAWHAPYYIRRVRVKKAEPIYNYLATYHPELIEDDEWDKEGAIIGVPQKAPETAIIRTETALDLLERVKLFSTDWVQRGHRTGDNTHNVSATISIKGEEWDAVKEWMWDNRDSYNGLSVLPYDGGGYVQAPFEDCTEEKYNALLAPLKDVNLDFIVESEDSTDLSGEIACAGGACEVDFSYDETKTPHPQEN